MKAIHLPVDRDIIPDEFTTTVPLTSFQNFVGGWVEPIKFWVISPNGTRQSLTMYVNEDAIALKLRPNPRASKFVGYEIRGPVIITGPELDGEDTDPPYWMLSLIIYMDSLHNQQKQGAHNGD